MPDLMKGTCRFCGQTRMTDAATQEQADIIAAENCTCDNALKRARQLRDNVQTLCGEASINSGFEIVTEEVIDQIKDAGELCVHGYIRSAAFTLADSTVTIKSTNSGVSAVRKKVSSIKLEA